MSNRVYSKGSRETGGQLPGGIALGMSDKKGGERKMEVRSRWQ